VGSQRAMLQRQGVEIVRNGGTFLRDAADYYSARCIPYSINRPAIKANEKARQGQSGYRAESGVNCAPNSLALAACLSSIFPWNYRLERVINQAIAATFEH